MITRLLALLLTAGLLFGGAERLGAQSYSDEQLVAAWEQLKQPERKEVCEWFRYEAEGLSTGQAELIRIVADQIETDRGYWPTPGPKPIFAPGGRRRLVAPDSEASEQLRSSLSLAPETRLWTYDFATRRLLRHGDPRDPERIFREALAGHAPEEDFTLAEVARRLDDGSLLNENAALSHAYSDAEGRVYPEVSLYDFLAADEANLLSETDARGLVFSVDDELGSSETEAGARDAGELQARVREIFERVRTARETIDTLARIYLYPKPELSERYGDPLELHALWLSADSDPDQLRERLPDPQKLDDFLATWRETFRVERLRSNATYRQRSLIGSEYQVRALFERIFEQFGAFEPRTEPKQPEVVAAVEPAEPRLELAESAAAKLMERLAKERKRERTKLIAACLEAALASGAPQVELVRVWSGRAEQPLDQLDGPTHFAAHEAKVYGGGPKRRVIGPGDRLFDALAKQVVRAPAPDPRWRADYEPATRKIVALQTERDPLVDLELLLEGNLPDEDLARAVLLAELDRAGKLTTETEYFAHTYTDREGNAYDGLSLAEVWSSSVELEVPDVDALAYIQKVWNDPTVKPPLSEADHRKWYPRMGESLARVRHRKQLTRALAAVWFDGRPELSSGYDSSIDLMHALIARSGENAGRVAEGLDENERLYLQRGLKQIVGLGDAGWNAGNERRDALAEGRERIRQAVLSVLAERGWIGE